MPLSPNKRILLNVLASYGRSVFMIICGLISGRWALMALGEIDYGLFGLISGLTAFVTFFNGLLAGAVGRFYAYSIGEVQKLGSDGLENCQKWFNTALLIHTVIPIALIIIGYPLGAYAVRHWLTIPPGRIYACIWLWRFVCISTFLGMFSIPWNSFYEAKQMMAELTIYQVVVNGLNVFFLYYIVNHPGDWLIANGLWWCALTVIPCILISFRALCIFPECRFRREYLWSWDRAKRLFSFAGWQTFGALGALLRGQGVMILVNKFFGPTANAASSVASHISGKTLMFSSAFIGSFAPAITNACGAKDFKRMHTLAFMTCKFGVMLTLLFALPIAIELPLLVQYWLKNPPQYAVGLCWCVLATTVVDQTSVGHMLAVNANGKIAMYQTVLGTMLMLSLPIAWILIVYGFGVYSIGYASIVATVLCAWGRVFFARSLVGMPIRYWAFHIMLPLALLAACSLIVGYLPRLFMPPHWLRVIVSASLLEIVFVSMGWFIVFSREEKVYVASRVHRLFQNLKARYA